MIQSAFYNGINFSGDFARTNELINFNAQRVKNILPDADFGTLCFEVGSDEYNVMLINNITSNVQNTIYPTSLITVGLKFLAFYNISSFDLISNCDIYFEVRSGADNVEFDNMFSEIYRTIPNNKMTESNIVKISAYNNNSRHGLITSANPAFGFFKTVGFNEYFFINNKTEYEYSYSRKKILSSENNVGKRLTFKNLTKYNQILLKWLANCENFYIDGVKYELISDFSELLNDENSEIMDLRADFIKSEQSFFATGSQTAPTNVFEHNFFMK